MPRRGQLSRAFASTVAVEAREGAAMPTGALQSRDQRGVDRRPRGRVGADPAGVEAPVTKRSDPDTAMASRAGQSGDQRGADRHPFERVRANRIGSDRGEGHGS
ncbi:MAG: hypothetical protein MZV70_45450 [Desulfobacterales bacterium]|nr:hypothetical protein [Desulfobacterales bacterium]